MSEREDEILTRIQECLTEHLDTVIDQVAHEFRVSENVCWKIWEESAE